MTHALSLHTLKQNDLEFSDPAEDIRGHNVVDQNGDHIGKVDALMVDDREHKVRFMRVTTGGILGFHEIAFLISVEAITAIHDNAVDVDRSGGKIVGGPADDPDLVDQQTVLDYYTINPYWATDYAYPDYPYRF